MIIYFDTSALLKKYFKEDYTDDVIGLWKESTSIITSNITYAESMASINRKKTEAGANKNIIKKIIKSFNADWDSFIKVNVNDDLNSIIARLTRDHPLRGFDAIHLASAMIMSENIHDNYLFACFDKKLLGAAKKEGLKIFPDSLRNI